MSTEARTPATGDVPVDTWGTRLLIARTQRGLKQEQAADLCGLNRASWSTWERGTIPRNQARVTKQIAKALGYDLTWLLWGGPLAGENDGGGGPDGGLPRLDSNQRDSDYMSHSSASELSQARERRRNARASRHWNPFSPRRSDDPQEPAATA